MGLSKVWLVTLCCLGIGCGRGQTDTVSASVSGAPASPVSTQPVAQPTESAQTHRSPSPRVEAVENVRSKPVALSAAAIAGWRHALLTARRANIARLKRYRKRGVFPTFNEGFGKPKKRTDPAKGKLRHAILLGRKKSPVFIDDLGTHCAVAYLMRHSGWGGVVDNVARTNNYVYINDIANGPVIDWIELSGLTKAEAAEIQPGYMTQYEEDLEQRWTNQWKLTAHFRRMENKLARDSKRSIDAIMKRLMPRIKAGLPIGLVGAKQPPLG